MSRFRPTVESLDDRAMPSAVFASADDYTPPTTQMVQVADTSGDAGEQEDAVAKKKGGSTGGYMKITMENVLISSYS